MKSRAFVVLFVLAAFCFCFGVSPAIARPSSTDNPYDRSFEIGIWGGLMPSRLLGTTTHQEAWSSFLLNAISEKAVITSKPNSGLAAGGFFSLFFTPHLGLQLLAGYSPVDIPSGSSFDFAWRWADGTGDAKTTNWTGSGSLTRLPISLNVALREGTGRFTVEFSGGLTYFLNTFSENAVFGYGVMKILSFDQGPGGTMIQTVDALPVRLTIPATTWSAVGGNIGGSLNFRILDTLGLKAEARYFYCPPKNLNWTPVIASYDGLYTADFPAEPFTAADVAYLALNGETFAHKLDLSFIQASLGIYFSFGRHLPH
ncbi:MAG: hypothetical protein ABSF88_11250 [Candidatus Aminicenantales bacterium]